MNKLNIIEEIIEEIEAKGVLRIDVFNYLLSIKSDLVSELMDES